MPTFSLDDGICGGVPDAKWKEGARVVPDLRET